MVIIYTCGIFVASFNNESQNIMKKFLV